MDLTCYHKHLKPEQAIVIIATIHLWQSTDGRVSASVDLLCVYISITKVLF